MAGDSEMTRRACVLMLIAALEMRKDPQMQRPAF